MYFGYGFLVSREYRFFGLSTIQNPGF